MVSASHNPAADNGIKFFGSDGAKLDDAREIASAVNDVRRELRRRSVSIEKAKESLTKALEEYQAEKAWRSAAQAEILPALRTYEEKIRDTIGLRQQPRLPREQALFVAGCSSDHRDISLSF